MPDPDPDIDADLVHRLVAAQFPQWAALPVAAVPRQGWDNRTFRLGGDLSVRLPSAAGYVAGIAKEDRCLPLLADHLPVAVPECVATGAPSPEFRFPWSVRRWLDGDTVDVEPALDRMRLASDLGTFLVALRGVPSAGGPAAGRHSAFRGCHPSVYGDEVQAALLQVGADVDVRECERIWAEAATTAWATTPVWFHGDFAAGNVLAADGRLCAVIDFGTCGVGDPACDLVIGWTHLVGDERQVFREAAGLTDDAWRRARGWALWKALVTLTGLSSPDPEQLQRRVLREVIADPVI